jgi:hypothetical protein
LLEYDLRVYMVLRQIRGAEKDGGGCQVQIYVAFQMNRAAQKYAVVEDDDSSTVLRAHIDGPLNRGGIVRLTIPDGAEISYVVFHGGSFPDDRP